MDTYLSRGKRTLILGVGNPLCGDDGLGPALIERLRGKSNFDLINCEDVPENYLGVIEAASPEQIVIVDGVDLGINPGEFAWLQVEQLSETSLVAHNTSLKLFARVVQEITGAPVKILAVQPATTSFDAPMSSAVNKTLEHLEEWFQHFSETWNYGRLSIPIEQHDGSGGSGGSP